MYKDVAIMRNCGHDPQARVQISVKRNNWCDHSLDLKLVPTDGQTRGESPGGGLGRAELCLRLLSLLLSGKKECL